jgi:hypothetical protein
VQQDFSLFSFGKRRLQVWLMAACGKIIVYKQRKICYHMKASVGGRVLRTRKNGHDSGPFPFHPNIFAGAFFVSCWAIRGYSENRRLPAL